MNETRMRNNALMHLACALIRSSFVPSGCIVSRRGRGWNSTVGIAFIVLQQTSPYFFSGSGTGFLSNIPSFFSLPLARSSYTAPCCFSRLTCVINACGRGHFVIKTKSRISGFFLPILFWPIHIVTGTFAVWKIFDKFSSVFGGIFFESEQKYWKIVR